MFNYVPFASDALLPSIWNVQTEKALLSCLLITWVLPYISKIVKKLNKPDERCFVLQSSYSYTEEIGPLRQWALKGKWSEHCEAVKMGASCVHGPVLSSKISFVGTVSPFLSCNGKTRRGVTLCAPLDVTIHTFMPQEPLSCLPALAVKLISWGSS